MQFRFTPAYIKLADAHALGWNVTQTIPFGRNAPAVTLTGSSVFDAGNLDLKGRDKPEFWCFSVCFGYQPGAGEDGDAHEEIPITGATPETSPLLIGSPNRPFGYSVIYMEGIRIRDYEFGIRPPPGRSVPRGNFTNAFLGPRLAQEYLERLYAVTAHEIGHAPGRQWHVFDHRELRVMDKGAPPSLKGDIFHPKTIKRFRAVESWTR